MASLSSITNSIFSASNENTLALAALKFDFSLMKVEAPVEFTSLGSALTSKRRSDAEDGPVHKSARKLGALFEQLIPSTPKLIRAYGLRTSEIIEKPGINPSGSDRHGPFASFVGADGTAMWAAATSGISALGVYLLSCLLARAWDSKESVSIWVELVAERRRQIEEAFRDNHLVSESSLLSARHEISRQELALWDASTRAWLRSADQAKVWEQDQLMLIVKNVSVPFSHGSSTYTKVIEAWRQAMIGLENLLHGRPQSISNGEVLLALSAWHLFPDLIVLGRETTNVKFNDPLVPQAGVGTIGLQPTDAKRKAIQWSLTLSHLRYYGGPVVVESSQDFSRVTIGQLRVVTLGSILGAWRVRPEDVLSTATWFLNLWEFLKQTRLAQGTPPLSSGFGWLYNLVQAARLVLSSHSEGDVAYMKLLRFGQRRAQNFLGQNSNKLSPFFGLRNPCVLAGLTERFDVECAVRYFREVARNLGLKCGEAIIYYVYTSPDTSFRCHEYATAVPHPRSSPRKRDTDGRAVGQTVHARWLAPVGNPVAFDPRGCLSLLIRDTTSSELYACVTSRIAEIASYGEQGILITKGPTSNKNNLEWENPPALYQQPFDKDSKCPSINNSSISCSCFHESIQTVEDINPRTDNTQRTDKPFAFTQGTLDISEFCPLIGDWPLGLFVRKERSGLCPEGPCLDSIHKKNLQIVTEYSMLPLVTSDWTREMPICRGRLFDYLCCIGSASDAIFEQEKDTMRMRVLSSLHRLPQNFVWSLHAIAIASRVYENLEGATISLKVVTYPLHHQFWVPCKLKQVDFWFQDPHDAALPVLRPFAPTMPNRSRTFACIASLESGTLNLEPSNLNLTFAMCSENSIFVSGRILSDPFDVVADYDVRRIVGNIGHSGVCFLVAPQKPKIRPLSNNFNVVNHATYDLKREDNFKGTSLHLSFTEWSIPMVTNGARTIDQDVRIVESVVSTWDRGEWVADLDILCIDFERIRRFDTGECPGTHKETAVYDYTSLDSWEELLDSPQTVGFFRAHGNWAARLAAVSIISQKGQGHSIGVCGPRNACLRCMENEYGATDATLLAFESPLPSFCID